MDFREFSKQTRKADSRCKAKVRNSFGVYDIYKLIRKNHWYNIGRPLTEHEFYTIIREVNKLFAIELANGREMVFPHRMGALELRKSEKGVSIVNGKVRVTYPVDWEETLRLWYEDEEARKNKTLLRNENKFVYHIKYNKYNAFYENKSFYQFSLNRFIKKALSRNIKSGKTDTLW